MNKESQALTADEIIDNTNMEMDSSDVTKPLTETSANDRDGTSDRSWSAPRKTVPLKVGLGGGPSVTLRNSFESLSQNDLTGIDIPATDAPLPNNSRVKGAKPPPIHFAKMSLKSLLNILEIKDDDKSFYVREVDEK